MSGQSKIYDARSGSYIRGGTSSTDPGGKTVYHIDNDSNASSFKNTGNKKSVFYPDAEQDIVSNVTGNYLDSTYDANGYSPLIDSFLNSTSNSALHDIMEGQLNLAERNSALSQQMAREANTFSHDESALARAWSAEQAKIQRDWQTEMSNSAHQREVSDLIASGLNPILSANAGASTPSGGIPAASNAQSHQGQVDTTSAYQIATSLMQSMISSAVQMKSLDIQQAMQDKSIALQKDQMANELQRTQISADAQKESAATGAYGAITASRTSADAQKHHDDTQKEITQMNNDTNRYIAELQSETQHETSKYGIITDMLEHPEKYAENIGKTINLVVDYMQGKNPDGTYKLDPYWESLDKFPTYEQ